MDTKKFGDALKAIRLEKKMSLRQFGNLIGISHTYVNKLEKGIKTNTSDKEIMPTIETLIKISDALKLPLHKFLYMCGYLDEDYEDNLQKSINSSVIDLKQYAKEIIANLENAKYVTVDGKSLQPKDIETISRALKIALEMTNKNISKKNHPNQ